MSMKIKRLEIEGYKSLKHVVWEPGDLNVLIGPNGSGKSNLLGMLEVLSASARTSLEEFIRKESGLEVMLWDKRAESISADLTVTASASDIPADNAVGAAGYKYKFELGFLGERRSPGIIREHLSPTRTDGSKVEVPLLIQREGDKYNYSRGDTSRPQSGTDVGDLASVLLRASHDSSADNRLRDLASWLGELKVYQGFVMGHDSLVRQPTVTRYERSLSPNGWNLINFLHTMYTEYPDFKEEVDTTMRAAFGSDFHELIFTPAADQYIQMRIRWEHLQWPQPAGVLSDGILRYLFMVAALTSPDPPSILAIDEPEIGFHPAMFPIIAKLAARASERTQVVLTTHSPEFLNAFEDVQPTITVFEWHDGETEMRNLSDENLKYWLEKYKLGELFRTGGLEAID